MCNCELDLSALLCNIPSEWREGIVKLLCKYKDDLDNMNLCEEVENCQTLTLLSPFSVERDNVCITYKDEIGTLRKKCFNILQLFADSLNTLDFCEVSEEDWKTYTFPEKMQAIIDAICDRMPETTTTTTTTTTSSTTTTTTVPCPVVIDIELEEITTTTTSTTTSTSTTTTTTLPPSTTTTTTVEGQEPEPTTTTTTTSSSTTTTTTTPIIMIAGTVEENCNDEGCTQQGETQLKFTFTEPTPSAVRILFGYIEHVLTLSPSEYWARGYSNVFQIPAWAKAHPTAYTANAMFIDIPAGVTTYTTPRGNHDGTGIEYLNATLPNGNPRIDTCQSCQSPTTHMYFKPPTGYSLNLTSTQGKVVTNVPA